MLKKVRILMAVFLVAAFMLSGCINDEPKEKEKEQSNGSSQYREKESAAPIVGGKLRFGVLSLPEWNPLKWEEATPQYSPAERLVYRGLFTYSEKGEWVGDLIEKFSLESKENGTKILHLTLKENQKWQDGTPITFEDVRFTLQTYLDPFFYGAWKQNLSYISGTSSYRSGKKESISGITQSEDGEIQLILDNPTSSFFHALVAPILPAHLLKGKKPEEINALITEGKIIGSGPFKFESKNEKEIRLTRGFPKEEGGPYLDEISFVLYDGDVTSPDKANGYQVLAVPPQESPTLPKNYLYTDVTQNLYYYLGFNYKDEVTSKPEVRKAIHMGIDRAAIVNELLFGHGAGLGVIPAAVEMPDDSIFHAPAADVENARNIMGQLGYSAEKPLTITLHYQADQPVAAKLADILSEQLQRMNIRLLKKPLNGEEYYAYLFSGQPVQAFIHAWPAVKDSGLWWKLYGSYHDVKDLGLNILHYENKEADQILKELYAAMPDGTEKEKKQAFLKIMNQDLPVLPLFAPKQTYWIEEGVHGFAMNGDGWLLHAENWWVEK